MIKNSEMLPKIKRKFLTGRYAQSVLEQRVQGEDARCGREAVVEAGNGIGQRGVLQREGGGPDADVDVGLHGGHRLGGGVADQPFQVLQAQDGKPVIGGISLIKVSHRHCSLSTRSYSNQFTIEVAKVTDSQRNLSKSYNVM